MRRGQVKLAVTESHKEVQQNSSTGPSVVNHMTVHLLGSVDAAQTLSLSVSLGVSSHRPAQIGARRGAKL